MPREEYQERLESLREDVLYMSELVRERLRLGLTALDGKDESTAREVIDADDEINELYLALESDCVDLIALQQPVAGDLRFIAASFKIITDLERIGDLAVNLGEYTLDAEADVYPDVDVRRIGEFAERLVADAMDAYADADTAVTREIDDRDDELDQLCNEASENVVRGLLDDDSGDTERLLSEASRLLLTIRDLERIGDHAVNVAARTLYMIEDDDELIY
jgi:phosphate uptake regulator, PhoU